MKKFRMFLFPVLALFTLAIAMSPASAHSPAVDSGRPFATVLLGANEVPGPGDPDGMGRALITVNLGRGRVCWWIQVSGITLPATAAHIHNAPAGVAGPIVVPLSPPDTNGTSRGCAEDVDRHLLLNILIHPSDYYVNVHTTDYPAGAVRGQLDHRVGN